MNINEEVLEGVVEEPLLMREYAEMDVKLTVEAYRIFFNINDDPIEGEVVQYELTDGAQKPT